MTLKNIMCKFRKIFPWKPKIGRKKSIFIWKISKFSKYIGQGVPLPPLKKNFCENSQLFFLNENLPYISSQIELLRYWNLFNWPKGLTTMLILSVIDIPTQKTHWFGYLDPQKPLNSSLKRVLNHCFIELFSPKYIPKILEGFKWPLGLSTMLLLSILGKSNPKKNLQWVSRASKPPKSWG